jgi:endonuclease/exonuclease/phosphatase family metal-dependent hydrolase
MKIITCLLGFLFSSFALGQTQLKIQQLNFNAEAENLKLADYRYEAMLNHIQSENLDLVFIEECWRYKNFANVGEALAQALGYDIFYHYEDGVSGIFTTSNVILAKKSLHLRNTTSVKLPDSAWTIGNGSPVWISLGETSELVGGTFDLPNGTVGTVWVTHLSESSQKDRINEINYIIDFTKSYDKQHNLDWDTVPAILGGDMNADSGGAETALYTGAGGFTDSWNVAHPGVRGLTLVNDPTNPEYDPMVHSSGQFPSQYVDQGTGRIDYIYYRNLSGVGVGSERIFTSPLARIWMSDHYSLMTVFNFDGSDPNLPDADSDMAAIGSPTIYNVNEAALNNPNMTVDFDVTSLRGFTMINSLNTEVDFLITSNTGNVYNSSVARTTAGDIASFTFFASGDYKYMITVTDPWHNGDGGGVTWGGTLHVH